MTTKDPFLKAYTQHKSNAKTRGVEMRMTFAEWKDVWLLSGKWHQRGKFRGQFCMCRIGDFGHYEVGNVFIGEVVDNVSFAQKDRLKSEITRHRMSVAWMGVAREYCRGPMNVMHRPEVKAKMSAAIGGGRHYRAKRVISPYGEFPSGTVAAKLLGIPKPTVHWRCKHEILGWSYAAT